MVGHSRIIKIKEPLYPYEHQDKYINLRYSDQFNLLIIFTSQLQDSPAQV